MQITSPLASTITDETSVPSLPVVTSPSNTNPPPPPPLNTQTSITTTTGEKMEIMEAIPEGKVLGDDAADTDCGTATDKSKESLECDKQEDVKSECNTVETNDGTTETDCIQ